MRNLIRLALVLTIVTSNVFAQKYMTKTGSISFYSDAPVEKIEAHNKQVNIAYDVATTDLVCKVLIKSFEFEKALMQEHFNENYLESDKYPTAIYKGKITNASEINFGKDGSYKATTEGDLIIHGAAKKIKESGVIQIKGGKAFLIATFTVLLKDYNVKVPNNLINNISDNIKISINAELTKL